MNGIEFVNRIDSLLKAKNENRTDISRKLNFDRNKIAQWKQNNTIPSADIVFEIAKYFGVSMEFLLTGEDCNYTPIDLPKIEILDKDTSEAITLLRKAISLLQK